MNYKIALAFLVGGVVGAAATWSYAKKHFSEIADEEIASVKRVYAREKNSSAEEEEQSAVSEQDVRDYAKEVSRLNYSGKSADEDLDDAMDAHKRATKPYVIPPEEFGELDDHETVTWYHHTDGVLSDEDGRRVEDVDGSVGRDYAKHFGEYDDSAVHIRNDRLKMDYEILLDTRSYAEVLKSSPYLLED